MKRSLLDRVLRLFFPWGSQCVACKCLVGNQSSRYLCDACLKALVPARHEFLSGEMAEAGISGSAAPFAYAQPVIGLVRALKYGHLPGAGDLLWPHMACLMSDRASEFDLVMPVPLHPDREYERGYNQSEMLARGIVRELNIPLSGALHRIRSTRKQAQLSHEARLTNLTGAFAAGDEVAGRRILLIDDVLTTGSTVMECARALKKAGAGSVYVCTAAMAAAGQQVDGDYEWDVLDLEGRM